MSLIARVAADLFLQQLIPQLDHVLFVSLGLTWALLHHRFQGLPLLLDADVLGIGGGVAGLDEVVEGAQQGLDFLTA